MRIREKPTKIEHSEILKNVFLFAFNSSTELNLCTNNVLMFHSISTTKTIFEPEAVVLRWNMDSNWKHKVFFAIQTNCKTFCLLCLKISRLCSQTSWNHFSLTMVCQVATMLKKIARIFRLTAEYKTSKRCRIFEH